METAERRSKDESQRIAIVGAGIVGISTAIWLQRAGFGVVVIDRNGPAGGTSYGNAGVLSAASVVPVAVPGLLMKAPRMLLSSDAPLFLRWSYLPRLLPFLRRMFANANLTDVNRIAHSLSMLLQDTVDQHVALARGTGAEHFISQGDYVFGYKDRAAYEADALGWSLRRERGHEFEEMAAGRLAEYDPLMANRFGFAVRCANHGYISDPGEYVKALAAHMTDNGGELIVADVNDIHLVDGTAKGVRTPQGLVEAEAVVVASGVWSASLVKKLGVKVPLESERGYHIEFVNPSVTPRSPIMVASGKFVLTPMAGRLRCAGIIEFGGLDEAPSKAPIELLKRQTLELLPELTYDRIDEWMGHRPSTSDALPLIGAFEHVPNVWSAFGHQHIGLSAGPKTGRWIAQLIAGQKPNVNLAPFAPDRFQSGTH